MLKKLLISFLLSLTALFSFAPLLQAKADSTWYDTGYTEWFSKVYDQKNPSEIFGERYTAAQVQWIFYSIISLLVFDKPFFACAATSELSACTDLLKPIFPTSYAPTDKNPSLASLVFNSDRPISFISYAKNLGKKFTVVSEVHAQTTSGFGFQALNVIQDLWRASRDIMYGLFVIVAVVIAFMIMFRVKISPQVVISVQSAIPKLAIALILVTFSYAIAGLLVDLMYVVIGLVSVIFSSSGLFATKPAIIFNFITQGNVGGIPLGIFGVFFIYLVLFSIALFVALFAQNGVIIGVISLPIITVVMLIASIVLLVLILFNGFKVGWMLIKTFAQLLILTIVAPLQIGFGAVIQGLGFGSWLKAFIGNLAVFPLTGFLLILSIFFLRLAFGAAGDALSKVSGWDLLAIINPSLPYAARAAGGLGTGWPPLLGSSSGMYPLLYLGVSFMIFTLIPKAADIIKGLISGRPFAYGTAIGEAFVPIGWGWGQTGRPMVGAVQKAYSEKRTENLVTKLLELTSKKSKTKAT